MNMTVSQGKPVVFMDRDNTLIADPGYLGDASAVRLIDGAAEAVRRLRAANYEIVVVSNQSGVARGLMTEEDVQSVNRRMRELLAEQGADTDAIYYCPYLDGPEAVRETYRRDSDLRKPKPGMLMLAARDRGLDLGRSWMIGDSSRDMLAGKAAGCRTILLGSRKTASREGADHLATDLISAADLILESGAKEPSDVSESRHMSKASVLVEPLPHDVRKDSSPPGVAPRVEALLEQIIEELRTDRRERQHEEFSLGHLAGAVVQAFALCAIGWGIYAAVNSDASAATIRLLAGIAFQAMALTFFVAGRRK
jgi:D-glycero-D-manno-heptose 1,7-bisphosphate phosphatase